MKILSHKWLIELGAGILLIAAIGFLAKPLTCVTPKADSEWRTCDRMFRFGLVTGLHFFSDIWWYLGANPNLKTVRRDRYGYEFDGKSMLSITTRLGPERDVRYLLSRGADPNLPDQDGVVPISWALSGGNVGKVQAFLDVNANVKNIRALHSALVPDHPSVAVVARLLERGVDVNELDELETSALMRASATGDTALMRLLIQSGADVNVRNKQGDTAVTYAVYSHEPQTLVVLVQQGVRLRDTVGGQRRGTDQKKLQDLIKLIEVALEKPVDSQVNDKLKEALTDAQAALDERMKR